MLISFIDIKNGEASTDLSTKYLNDNIYLKLVLM